MKKEIIEATEAASSFSALINRARYHGQQFDIQCGRDIVASLIPAGSSDGLPIAQLNEVFAELPRLDKADAEAFADELQLIRQQLRPPRDAWD